jgi:hypothetical protein
MIIGLSAFNLIACSFIALHNVSLLSILSNILRFAKIYGWIIAQGYKTKNGKNV